MTFAPGWPGIPARWTSSAKSGIGTALSASSRVWFTLSHGILNEVYYPRVDQVCTRDLGLIVTDGKALFSEEKRHTLSETSQIAAGVPAYAVRNSALDHRFRIDKEILADPRRDVVLQRIRFVPLQDTLARYHVFALLAPHLANRGGGNTAWLGSYKATPMLFAERDGSALALACSGPWLARSVGFVGFSDGWQQLRADKYLANSYERAENGNVAVTGEVDLEEQGAFTIALAFGHTAMEAGQRAVMSLGDDFDELKEEYVRGWEAWLKPLARGAPRSTSRRHFYLASAAVLRTHESMQCEGGIIASLSIPWGFAKGDDDLGGYHLVWPRDLVEAGGGLLAAGALEDTKRVLRYLRVTQEADGHWSQNMWLDGTPYWGGIQMDETALPILLVDLAARHAALSEVEQDEFWPMVRRAATFIVRNGPVSPQDRWEEDPGYSPFTLAAEIAALVVAADLADARGDHIAATYLRETADAWNDSVERWTYVRGTERARRANVDGYYVRVGPPEEADAASPMHGFVPIKNRPQTDAMEDAALILSPDALALVRFGLRSPDDQRILDTIKVLDALLKVDTPAGPVWFRYNGDGYGEHDDGSPFDGTGVGRPWPLLTGERAHYELAAGHQAAAFRLARSMEKFAGDDGLIPEQVWDAQDIPDLELFFGRATGSARPLVWAHAEYIKLRRSLRDGAVFDRPPQTVRRYLIERSMSRRLIWRFNNKLRTMPDGKTLRIETLDRAVVHWSVDGWRSAYNTETTDTTLGVHVADLPTQSISPGGRVDFTFYWPDGGRWEGADFSLAVESCRDLKPRVE